MLKTHLQPIVAFLFNTPGNADNDRDVNSSQTKLHRDDYHQPMVDYYVVDDRNHVDDVNVSQDQSDQSDFHQPMIDYYFVNADQLDVSPASSKRTPAQTRLATFFSHLWRELTTPNNEPRVKQRFDRSGQEIWQTYDPLTDRHHTFFSEDEVYEWLEQRYYE